LLTEAHLAGANVTWMGSLKAFGTPETVGRGGRRSMSFDDLVGADEQRRRYLDTKGFGSP